jgi:hypothetical protein
MTARPAEECNLYLPAMGFFIVCLPQYWWHDIIILLNYDYLFRP